MTGDIKGAERIDKWIVDMVDLEDKKWLLFEWD